MKSGKSIRRALVNPGRAGVVYDAAGHSLGGGERLEIDDESAVDDVAKTAIDKGQLLLVKNQ